MGGRGASSGIGTGVIVEKKIREKMTKLYKQYGGFVRLDKQDVADARKRWLKMKEKADALAEKSRKPPMSNVKEGSQKTFTNGFGEATSREITSATYKRAQKRMEKDILGNMGY